MTAASPCAKEFNNEMIVIIARVLREPLLGQPPIPLPPEDGSPFGGISVDWCRRRPRADDPMSSDFGYLLQSWTLSKKVIFPYQRVFTTLELTVKRVRYINEDVISFIPSMKYSDSLLRIMELCQAHSVARWKLRLRHRSSRLPSLINLLCPTYRSYRRRVNVSANLLQREICTGSLLAGARLRL